MNDTTLQKLEFDGIREALAECCATALGKRLARSMRPSAKTGVVRDWLNQVRELLLRVEGLRFVYFDDRDVVRHELVQRIIKAYETADNARTAAARETAAADGGDL